MQILFIRHAQSTGNQEGRLQGQADFALSDKGKQQAQKLAKRLLAEADYPACICCSPLKRAVQTAEILIAQFSKVELPPASIKEQFTGALAVYPQDDRQRPDTIAVEYTDDLKELHNGIFEGLTWDEIGQRYPELCLALETSLEWIPIPEAESLQAARDRTRRFLHTLFQSHRNCDRIWVITHGGILQHLIAELLGCQRSWGMTIAPTALFEFWLDRSRWNQIDCNLLNTELWQIRRFNDCQHIL